MSQMFLKAYEKQLLLHYREDFPSSHYGDRRGTYRALAYRSGFEVPKSETESPLAIERLDLGTSQPNSLAPLIS